MPSSEKDRALREHLLEFLRGKSAHVDFRHATAGLPEGLRGVRPPGADHSAWELVEHLRLALWDILEFSRNAKHVSPAWPEGYWPDSPQPPSSAQWDKSIKAFQADLKAIEELVADPATDLYARIPWGDGQTILREAMLAADHNAYHIGQLVLVRKLLGAWE